MLHFTVYMIAAFLFLLRMITITHHWDGTALPREEQVEFSVAQEGERVMVRATAALPYGICAPHAPVGFTDGLWEYDVLELFAVAPDGTYIEIELGPRGHWLAYWFSLYRERVVREIDRTQLVYTAQLVGSSWSVECSFPSAWLPSQWADLRWNCYQIRRRGDAGEYDYLAWKSDPTVAPDFHRTECFASL